MDFFRTINFLLMVFTGFIAVSCGYGQQEDFNIDADYSKAYPITPDIVLSDGSVNWEYIIVSHVWGSKNTLGLSKAQRDGLIDDLHQSYKASFDLIKTLGASGEANRAAMLSRVSIAKRLINNTLTDNQIAKLNQAVPDLIQWKMAEDPDVIERLISRLSPDSKKAFMSAFKRQTSSRIAKLRKEKWQEVVKTFSGPLKLDFENRKIKSNPKFKLLSQLDSEISKTKVPISPEQQYAYRETAVEKDQELAKELEKIFKTGWKSATKMLSRTDKKAFVSNLKVNQE